MSKYSAVVLAAGRGSRMNSKVSKQFLELLGKPIIYYALKAFEESPVDEIILVTGEKDIPYCKEEIVLKYDFQKVTHVVAGGAERYNSVWRGLQACKCDYVLIHDGARCFIDQDTILRCMEAVKENKSCVAAVPVKDTIKVVDREGFGINTPDRSTLWTVQTPQTFDYKTIASAYLKLHEDIIDGIAPSVTDDTMVAEYYMNVKSKMVMGSYYNIKVTTPEDMILGEAILKQNM